MKRLELWIAPLSVVTSVVAFLALSAPVAAADFIRGDPNEDGVVSIADAHNIFHFLFLSGEGIECGDSADVDDDGRIDITDGIRLLLHLVEGGKPPKAPFPTAGPDETDDNGSGTDARWPCDSYGGGTPLEDASAVLRILQDVAPGGAEGGAAIHIGLSNSRRVAGYSATIDAGGIVEDPSTSGGSTNFQVSDLSGTMEAGFAEAVYVKETGKIRVGFLSTFVGEMAIPPRESQIVLEIQFCLKPGTPAGAYPIVLEEGELADYETARRIVPALVSGSLVVLEKVGGSECVIEPSDPRRPDLLDALFELGDASGSPGSEVTVPFAVEVGDQAITRGLNFAIGFDETVLEIVGIETVLPRPDGQPWAWERPYVPSWTPDADPEDFGVAVGEYMYGDLPLEEPRFPTDEKFTALNLRFRIRPEATVGATDVGFTSSAERCFEVQIDEHLETRCFPAENSVVSGQADLSPELVGSFVFVNARINIVPDVTVFIRGDANLDRTVDLSDAQSVLNFLFLGSSQPRCLDAGDANDDGNLNISDPIYILQFLFLGGPPLPPPNDVPGEDPTPDGITCGTWGA